ncbi:MAG: nuclease-related domain-containing protein [Nocardioides sp.]|nr:nuclease-related domain-containing protein [Nocardioides sp.]
MDSDAVQVTRWKRYGKDRLYVTRADATKLGFWDLVTDEACAESEDHLPTIVAAAASWKAAANGTAPDESVVAPPVPVAVSEEDPPSPVPRPWLDLATNEAGAEAREQAVAAREAAPVKTVLARVLRVHTDERAWRIGADGEEKVAAQLAKVTKKDPRWHILHAIPIGTRGSDIDHLIIGPGGVFAANAKHHPKAKIWVGGNTFMVNGHKQPYLRNSRYEATRAAKLLAAACGVPVHVEGLIVPVNAADVVVKTIPAGAHVVPRRQVAKWLVGRGEVLTIAEVQGIFDAARRSTTWQP